MAAVLATFQHHSAPRGPRTARTGEGARAEVHGRVPEDALPQAAGAAYFEMDTGRMTVPHLPPRGQHRCLRCCRTHGYSSAPWSILSTLCRWSHCSMCLRRRWWNNCWTFLHLSISMLPSRLSKCPRLCVHPALLAQSSVRRRRQTSWWKCRRLSPILRYYSGLWSRTLPFPFLLVVEGETQIFQVFSVDRVQQRSLRLWNAFVSRLWNRSLTSPLLVEIFMVFAQDRAHPQLRILQLLGLTLRMSRFNGFFALFPRRKKVRMSPGTWVRVCPGTSAHPPSSAYGPRTWVDDDTGEVWTLLTDPALGSWWYSSRTRRSQWHPPWER